MGIALHQQMVLERARLAFIRVARDVARLLRLAVDELPLHARGEARAASTAQPRRLHDFDDVLRLHRERLPKRLITLMLQVEIEREAVRLADVFFENWIHFIHWRRGPTPGAN